MNDAVIGKSIIKNIPKIKGMVTVCSNSHFSIFMERKALALPKEIGFSSA